MADAIIFLQATPEYAEGITLVRRQTWLSTYPNEQENITRKDIEEAINTRTIEIETKQREERIRNDKTCRSWVAKDNGAVIGFAEGRRGAEKNRIHAVYIVDAYQHMGIGSELMKRVLEWLGNDKEIFFEVVTYNKQAIDFYKKFGFVENGATQNDVSKLPSGKQLPVIEMIRKPQNI